MRLFLIMLMAVSLSGCATALVTGAVVGTTAKVASTAVRGTAKVAVGTGKLVYRGGKAVATAGRRDDQPVRCVDIPDPKPQTCLDLSN